MKAFLTENKHRDRVSAWLKPRARRARVPNSALTIRIAHASFGNSIMRPMQFTMMFVEAWQSCSSEHAFGNAIVLCDRTPLRGHVRVHETLCLLLFVCSRLGTIGIVTALLGREELVFWAFWTASGTQLSRTATPLVLCGRICELERPSKLLYVHSTSNLHSVWNSTCGSTPASLRALQTQPCEPASPGRRNNRKLGSIRTHRPLFNQQNLTIPHQGSPQPFRGILLTPLTIHIPLKDKKVPYFPLQECLGIYEGYLFGPSGGTPV